MSCGPYLNQIQKKSHTRHLPYNQILPYLELVTAWAVSRQCLHKEMKVTLLHIYRAPDKRGYGG